MKKLVMVFGLLCSLVLAMGCSSHRTTGAAATPAGVDKQEAQIGDRVQTAAQDLDALMNAPDNGVPEEILSRAKCIAVIPDMVKGGFVFGAEHGRGFASCRTANGWSAPAPVALTGGSWGAQIGAQSADVVLLFMNDNAVQSLLNDQFKMGGEASIAAGPVGRHAQAATDAHLNAQILSYSRTKGLYLGLDLNGAKVSQDMDTTQALYGKPIPFRTILSGKVPAPAAAQPFVASVRKNFHEAAVAAKD